MAFTEVHFPPLGPNEKQLRAKIEDYTWSVANDDPDFPLLPLLNLLLDEDGPSGGDSQPDHNVAEAAIRIYGGIITAEELVDRNPESYPPGAVL